MASSNDVGAPPEVTSEISQKKSSKQQIDPYNVAGEVDETGAVKAIDYDRLIEDFGVQPLTEAHLQRFEQVTGKPAHRLMRRKLFFSHRDFDKILDYYEKHGTFMLYTGRGPSSESMHLGHVVPFLFTKELQELFDVPLVIMLTDDEKYLHTRNKHEGPQKKDRAPENFRDLAFRPEENIHLLRLRVRRYRTLCVQRQRIRIAGNVQPSRRCIWFPRLDKHRFNSLWRKTMRCRLPIFVSGCLWLCRLQSS